MKNMKDEIKIMQIYVRDYLLQNMFHLKVLKIMSKCFIQILFQSIY